MNSGMTFVQVSIAIIAFIVWLFNFNRYRDIRNQVNRSLVDEAPFLSAARRWLCIETILLLGIASLAWKWQESVFALVIAFLALVALQLVGAWRRSVMSDSIMTADLNDSPVPRPS